MAKGSGGTKGAVNGKKSTSASSIGSYNREEFAENLWKKGELSIDPDDAVYAKTSWLSNDQISDAIERATDFDVVGVQKSGDNLTLKIIDKYGDSYGPGSAGGNSDPVKEYDAGSKPLIDIIMDLRKNANKYYDKLF